MNTQVQVSKSNIKQPNQNTKISESGDTKQPSSGHKDKKQNLVGDRNEKDKHQKIASSHVTTHIVEIDDSKEHHIPIEFNEILSQINSETLPSLIITKVGKDSKIIGQTTLSNTMMLIVHLLKLCLSKTPQKLIKYLVS